MQLYQVNFISAPVLLKFTSVTVQCLILVIVCTYKKKASKTIKLMFNQCSMGSGAWLTALPISS